MEPILRLDVRPVDDNVEGVLSYALKSVIRGRVAMDECSPSCPARAPSRRRSRT